jgi:hypothetical protein
MTEKRCPSPRKSLAIKGEVVTSGSAWLPERGKSGHWETSVDLIKRG